MVASHDAIRVQIHKQAEKESRHCGFEPEALGVVFADRWKRVRQTPGTKLRRLSSTPGYDFRLRIGGYRAVASVAHDAAQRLTAYIHEVGQRREVYERDTFGERLKRFWGTGSGRSKQPNPGIAANYRELNLAAASLGNVPQASLHFLLQLQPQEFFDQVLPLLTHERTNHAELVIGHGPPGSGKTLVACDLAIEAFLDGHEVDVLVPSVGLEKEYSQLLKSWDALAVPDGSPGRGVRVWRYPAYFAHLAGVRPSFDRESRVRAWWHETLRQPAFMASLNLLRRQASGITDRDLAERMPVLIDALLEDDGFWSPSTVRDRTKDRMAAVFEEYRGMLAGCREALIERLDSAQNAGDHSLVTRAGLACQPIANLITTETNDGEEARPRLMIVDEAQDLAPAEWHRLLDAWFSTKPASQAYRGRLVLLGDLDQRVSLVPFHWDDVKAYTTQSLGVTLSHIDERQVDAASYRMRQNIARFASAVFDKRVTDQAKVRRHGRIEFDKLLDGGKVHVAIVDRRHVDVADVVASSAELQVAGEYLFVIHGVTAEAQKVPARDDLFLYSVRSAKGLEADRVIVVHPFEARQKHKPAPITADEATEYYTAVSRARDHVLLVIDTVASDLLSPATEPWKLATVHHVGTDSSRLRALVEACRITLSADEVRNELVRQLNQITTQPGEIGEQARVRIDSILTRLAKDPDDDLALALIQAGEQLAATDSSLFATVRDSARRDLASRELDKAVATLLFAGEIVLAERIVRSLPWDDVNKWDADWLGLIAADSRWQAWRYGFADDNNELVWTPDAVRKTVYDRAIDRLRGIANKVRS